MSDNHSIPLDLSGQESVKIPEIEIHLEAEHNTSGAAEIHFEEILKRYDPRNAEGVIYCIIDTLYLLTPYKVSGRIIPMPFGTFRVCVTVNALKHRLSK